MDRMAEERLAEFSKEADTYPPDDEFVLLVREIQRAQANEAAQARRIAALEAALREARKHVLKKVEVDQNGGGGSRLSFHLLNALGVMDAALAGEAKAETCQHPRGSRMETETGHTVCADCRGRLAACRCGGLWWTSPDAPDPRCVHLGGDVSCPSDCEHASSDGRGGGVKRKPGCTCMGMCRPDCGGNRNDPGHLLSCAIHAHGNCDCGATP